MTLRKEAKRLPPFTSHEVGAGKRNGPTFVMFPVITLLSTQKVLDPDAPKCGPEITVSTIVTSTCVPEHWGSGIDDITMFETWLVALPVLQVIVSMVDPPLTSNGPEKVPPRLVLHPLRVADIVPGLFVRSKVPIKLWHVRPPPI